MTGQSGIEKYKTCTDCKRTKPFSAFYFHKNKSATLSKRSFTSKCRICMRREKREKHRNNKYIHYKNRATYKDLIFTITEKEFKHLIHKPCIYCGKEPSMGLDRKNNRKGYVITNVVPCCKRCNRAKFRDSANSFIKHCFRVVKFQIERGAKWQ